MKVIDLINMISREEKVPKKINYSDEIFEFTGYQSASKNYVNELDDLFGILDGSMLNDEVEIIEEDNKIEKLKLSDYKEVQSQFELDVLSRINQIIDKIGD